MQCRGAQYRELAKLPVAVSGARAGFEIVEDRERVTAAVLRKRALNEQYPSGVVFAPDRGPGFPPPRLPVGRCASTRAGETRLEGPRESIETRQAARGSGALHAYD